MVGPTWHKDLLHHPLHWTEVTTPKISKTRAYTIEKLLPFTGNKLPDRHQETSAMGRPWSLAWDYTSTSGVEWDISAFCLHPENMGGGCQSTSVPD